MSSSSSSSDHLNLRDRTLVLRVLVPSLEVRLRDKMKEAEEAAVKSRGTTTTADANTTAMMMDLEGVTCEPAGSSSSSNSTTTEEIIANDKTLWHFHCDGATYPARLVNLPCPVELHKTHDHALYYKCTDVAQLLVVYEDRMAMEEAENAAHYKMEDFPSYYPSGLTPPMRRVVERRFARREHRAAAPPRAEVCHVEHELQDLMERCSGGGNSSNKAGNSGNKSRSSNKQPILAPGTTKVVEDVVEDVVDYAPWMDDYGRMPYGVEFDDQDPRCTKHPELWLDPEEIAKINLAEAERAAAEEPKKKSKKDGTKKKSKKKSEKRAEKEADKGPSVKKGIPSKKSKEVVDEITQAAAQMSQDLNAEDILGAALDDFFNFSDDGDDPMAGLEL